MTFKFGQSVEITRSGFYQGAIGILLYYSISDNSYTVRLEHGVTRDFFKQDLKVSKRKAKV